MKLGVSMWSMVEDYQSDKLDVKGFIDIMHEQGIKGVELLDFFWKDKETEIETVKKMLADYNMEMACYSIGNDFVVDDADARKIQIEYVKSGIDDAVRLNADKLRVFSGSPKENVSYEDGKKYILDSFSECSKYAEKNGVTMVLENHGLFAGKSDQVKDIIETVGSNYLRSNPDTGNFLLVGEKPEDAVDKLKKYIRHVHFKDFAKSADNTGYQGLDNQYYQGCILGDGIVNMNKIVDILDKYRYDGYLCIEFEGPAPQIKGTVDSINYVKSLLG